MALTEEQREIALLPCPFCGSLNIGGDHIQTYSLDSSYDVFGCMDCGARFEDGDASDWNMRTEAPIAQPASAPSEQKPVAEIVPMTKEQIWEAFQNNGFGKARALTYSDAHSFSKFRQGVRAAEAHHSKHAAPQPDYKAQRDAERYRFLRDSQEGKTIRIKPRLLWNEEIDAAIASVKGGA